MVSYKFTAVVATILLVGATAQENTLAAVADLANNPASAFVYVPQTSVTGEITVSCQIELPAGSRACDGPPNPNCTCAAQTGADSVTSLRSATYWPALTGLGISQSAFTLAPCTLRSPHIHERASGILYAAQGKICMVNFGYIIAAKGYPFQTQQVLLSGCATNMSCFVQLTALRLDLSTRMAPLSTTTSALVHLQCSHKVTLLEYSCC